MTKITVNLFFTITNCQRARSHSLTHRMNYKLTMKISKLTLGHEYEQAGFFPPNYFWRVLTGHITMPAECLQIMRNNNDNLFKMAHMSLEQYLDQV